MAKVYGFMGIGLAVSGLVAFLTASSESIVYAIMRSAILRTATLIVPFIICMTMVTTIHKMSKNVALAVFALYAATLGFSLSYIFLIFSSASIVSTFAVSAILFFGVGAYGFMTKKDLTGLGSFFRMGLFGLIVAMLVGMILKNSMLMTVLSMVTVVVFTGLAAYETQGLKRLYESAPDGETAEKNAIIGALMLYLDFVNIFVSLLRLFGSKK
jgi:FtsH-binding integral membrane protein